MYYYDEAGYLASEKDFLANLQKFAFIFIDKLLSYPKINNNCWSTTGIYVLLYIFRQRERERETILQVTLLHNGLIRVG